MWILVVRNQAKPVPANESAEAVLGELGCHVRTADLWDDLEHFDAPPTAIIVEARDQIEVGRACLRVLKESVMLRHVPILLAVTTSAVQRLTVEDAFLDFVLIPYLPVELYVRVRRVEWRSSEFSHSETLKIGPLVVDVGAHEVRVHGELVSLTPQEFALLDFLARNRGRVFSRQQLLDRVWEVDHYGESRTVDIHMRRIRSKLGTAATLLETVRGLGYKFVASGSSTT